MSQIPSEWPDLELWFVNWLPPILVDTLWADALVRNQQPRASGAYRLAYIEADLGRRSTELTRSCRLRLQFWSVRANRSADLQDARDFANFVGYQLESASPISTPILDAEVEAGPFRVKDVKSGIEYQYQSVAAQVTRN